MYPQQPNTISTNPGAYDFIVNPGPPPKRSIGGDSKLKRILLVTGGLIVLLIVFTVVKSLLINDGGQQAALAAVVSRQQELITTAKSADSGQQLISDDNRNSAVTVELSVSSAESQIISYAAKQHIKIPKQHLVSPSSKALKAQLTAAATAGTYDSTFSQVLKTQLTNYQHSLKRAYTTIPGAKGRELLNHQYEGATMLLRQSDVSRS